MLTRTFTFFGQPQVVACDGRCDKAWGINNRPQRQLGDDDDDHVYEGDGVLGIAPEDPGVYEGGDAKPTCPEDRLNKWCIRECERSVLANPGESLELPNMEWPEPNQPWKHIGAAVGE